MGVAGRAGRLGAALGAALAVGTAAGTAGCATRADFEKLRKKVIVLERAQGKAGGRDEGSRVADLSVEVDRLRKQVQELGGRIEVAEHQARRALDEARAARAQAAAAGVARAGAPEDSEARPEAPAGTSPDEVKAYRTAYASWRKGDVPACIDRFRDFLQTYPASAYADDAAYWMADCYFKNGDFKTAVLRFDDVAQRYPTGNKAADALYRQGEALLRLGPNYGKAAGKAFERVLREYPDSARVPEAKRQLEVLRSG